MLAPIAVSLFTGLYSFGRRLYYDHYMMFLSLIPMLIMQYDRNHTKEQTREHWRVVIVNIAH